ncbi:MAG: DegT/DnrJ/EryC1/StrS family aminotransferase [Chloroflexi bacterium]|jgi:dTDP-4-amino-4,6-dideoxygalactose transaminase|nr:DegT/DnrJ/EryC1/StrS family aminotransferase [Chloroflexota bacterium]
MTVIRQIPFFPYSELFTAQEEEILAIMTDVCRRGAFIMQKDLRDFEQNVRNFTGAKHVLGVANGTDALIIGLKACGVGPGDEVIMPSHTYIATAASVHMVGATPVLAECGPDNMLDPGDIEHRITPRTKGIMPVQVNGRTCDMDAIQAIAERHGLEVYEDAAQALGSKFKGRCAGTFGRFGTISFYPAKMLGCFGDGGAIFTNEDDLAREMGLLRDHGRNEHGRVVAWGLNSRLDNVQAAVLDFKLKSYPQDIERRRKIAALYHAGLGDLDQVQLPPAPDADPRHFDVYQNFEMQADRRDELRAYLLERGIRTIIQWAGTPVHQFSELGFDVDLPRTERFFERCMMPPMNTALSDDDVAYIVESIHLFYGA